MKTALIIDNDSDAVAIFTAFLTADGFDDVTAVVDGTKAIEHLRATTTPDLIILEPAVAKGDVLSTICATSCRVLIITANAALADRLAREYSDVYVKPVRLNSLL